MKKIVASLVVAGALVVGTAIPANAYYVTTSGCKTGYSKTWQVAWWDPMGMFGTWRAVCHTPSERVPMYY